MSSLLRNNLELAVAICLVERLQVYPETLKILADNGIEVEVLQTEAAIKRFNELREAGPTGGLFHSTC